MAEDQAQRTEAATPKRREDARRKGQVAQSRDLQSLAVLLASVAALGLAGLGIAEVLAGVMRWSLEAAARPPRALEDFTAALFAPGGHAMLALLPFLLAVPLVAAVVQLAQVGPVLSFEALQFKGERLDPFKGLARLVKLDRWVELIKTIAKLAVISAAAWWAFEPELEVVVGLSSATLGESAIVLGRCLVRVMASVLGVLALIAVIDVLFQRYNFEKQIRMSKREVRDELKQVEGDPMLRSRFRARQQELSKARMIAAVATADVVITNPTHYAVALRYDRDAMAAPTVLAKGKDRVAARIREAANRAGVPLVEEPPLARLLHRTTEVGAEIPKNLFKAVAEVLAVVYRLERSRAGAS